MSTSFARIYLDEDVDPLIAAILRSHGFEVFTTQGAKRKGKQDPDQLIFASENGYLILTHNRDDFVRLASEWFEAGRSHFGILVAIRRPPKEVVNRILKVLTKFTADEFRNQILIV